MGSNGTLVPKIELRRRRWIGLAKGFVGSFDP
jgi:hypothetical protein